MIHWITPDFPLSFTGNGTYRLRLKPVIFDLIASKQLQPELIEFSSIAYRDLSVDESSDRFKTADTSYPGVVLRSSTGLRLIDGRHRMKKLMSEGSTSGLFYVLQESDVRHFLEPVNTSQLPILP